MPTAGQRPVRRARATASTGRGKGRKTPVTRESILSATAKIYVREGYAGTTIRDIAAAQGLLPGSIYHHFSSKEKLVIELYEGGMARERICIQCRQTHLVVAEHAYCPLCRRVEAMLCKGCGGVLPEPSQTERRGRPRLYCSECECSHAHRVLLRTNGTHTLVRAVV